MLGPRPLSVGDLVCLKYDEVIPWDYDAQCNAVVLNTEYADFNILYPARAEPFSLEPKREYMPPSFEVNKHPEYGMYHHKIQQAVGSSYAGDYTVYYELRLDKNFHENGKYYLHPINPDFGYAKTLIRYCEPLSSPPDKWKLIVGTGLSGDHFKGRIDRIISTLSGSIVYLEKTSIMRSYTAVVVTSDGCLWWVDTKHLVKL